MESITPLDENPEIVQLSAVRSRAAEEASAAIARQLNGPLTALLLYMNEIKQHSHQFSQAPGNRLYLQQVVENALQQTERVCALVKQMADNNAALASDAAGKQAGEIALKALPNGGKCMGFVGLPGADNARERIEAMKAIWTQDEAAYHGKYVKFDPIWSWPKPHRKSGPPIILGGETDYTLERVVDYCDGWFPRPRGGFDVVKIGEALVPPPDRRQSEAGRGYGTRAMIFS